MAMNEAWKTWKRCCVPDCPNFDVDVCSSRNITFFAFPTDTIWRNKWIEILEINPETFDGSLHNNLICQDHFESDQFSNPERTRLIPHALPFKFSDPMVIAIKCENMHADEEIEIMPVTADADAVTDDNPIEIFAGHMQLPPLQENVTSFSEAVRVRPVPEDFAGSFPNILTNPHNEGVPSSSFSNISTNHPATTASQIIAEQRQTANILSQPAQQISLTPRTSTNVKTNPSALTVTSTQTIMLAPSPSQSNVNPLLQSYQWAFIGMGANGIPCIAQVPVAQPQPQSQANIQQTKTNDPTVRQVCMSYSGTIQQNLPQPQSSSLNLPGQTSQNNNGKGRGLKRKLKVDVDPTNKYMSESFSKKAASDAEKSTEPCIMCNAPSMSNDRINDKCLLEESQKIVRTFLRILSIYPTADEDCVDNIPFCTSCFGKAGELIEIHEKLLVLQDEFKNMRTKLARSLMTAFCERKANEGNRYAKIYSLRLDKTLEMADKLLEPRQRIVPSIHQPKSLNVTSKSSKDESQEDPSSSDSANLSSVPLEVQLGEEEWNCTNEDGDNFNDDIGEKQFHTESTLISPQTSTFDPLNLPNDIGEVVEICVGKRKTAFHQKWEALMNCPETAPGLEKLVPVYFRRVTCPVCQEKICPYNVSTHLNEEHSRTIDRKTLDFIKRKLLATSTVKLSTGEQRRTWHHKWKILAKYTKDNGNFAANLIPRKYNLVPCPTCGKMVTPYEMTVHDKRHKGVKPFKCETCGMRFSYAANLTRHRRRNHAEPKKFTYFCDLCKGGKFIALRTVYVNHILSEHSSAIGSSDVLYFYNCDAPDCRKCFRYKENLMEHLKSHSGCVHSCPSCDKVFSNQANYDQHVSSLHGSDIRFDCKYCQEYFDTEEGLNDHESVHRIRMSEETREHLCDDCGKAFKTKPELSTHKWARHKGSTIASQRNKLSQNKNGNKHPETHVGKFPAVNAHDSSHTDQPKTETYHCPVCNQKCKTEKKLTTHLLEIHTYENRLECYICGQSFTKLYPLKCHIIKHVGKPRKNHFSPCPFCQAPFFTRLTMRKHCLRNHPQEYLAEKPYYCSVCFFRFGSEGESLDHYKKLHEAWKCKICGKQCSSKCTFQRHSRVHTGERPFKCTMCEKFFSTKRTRYEHELQHKGVKPYKCDICSDDVGFYRKIWLKKHMEKVHSAKSENNEQTGASESKSKRMKLRSKTEPESVPEQEEEIEVINLSDMESQSGSDSEIENGSDSEEEETD